MRYVATEVLGLRVVGEDTEHFVELAMGDEAKLELFGSAALADSPWLFESNPHRDTTDSSPSGGSYAGQGRWRTSRDVTGEQHLAGVPTYKGPTSTPHSKPWPRQFLRARVRNLSGPSTSPTHGHRAHTFVSGYAREG
jgi:hypothetical protein